MSYINGIASYSLDCKTTNLYNTKNVKSANSYKGFRGTNFSDSVSFSGKNTQQYLYSDSWYLKDEEIISQDDFTTIIVDKNHKRSLLDKIKNKKYTKRIYDLPLRLREDLIKNNTNTVIQNEPSDILKVTGLSNKEFIKQIDKINSLIMLVAPRYDTFEDKTKQEFGIKLGSQTALVKRLSQGLSGIIYKIEVPDCKPLILKHYLNPTNINGTEGTFPEIALAKKMNEDKVNDIPLLYCANPYNGWMLSDYIDENFEKRKDGISFVDYVKQNKLYCMDINSGMAVKGKDCAIFVDFGYINPTDSKTISYDEVVISDNKKRVNDEKFLNSNDVSGLTIIENVAMYGTKESGEKINEILKTNPEMQLYCDITNAVGRVLTSREISEELAKRLQKNYEKSEFVGDAVELVKSANQ